LRVVGMPLALTVQATASYRTEQVLFTVVNQSLE
jgi:hypothetical protein